MENADEISQKKLNDVFGIYRALKKVLSDGDYYIDLNDVIQTICILKEVTYKKIPSSKDFDTNSHNTIKNIKTFYIKDYFLITKNEVGGTNRHKVTNALYEIGAYSRGRNRFVTLFRIPNKYQSLKSFSEGLFSEDLYNPIKWYINRLFFEDDNHISNFKVESEIKIRKSIK